MTNSDFHDEKINQSYQKLADHRGIGLAFLLSIVLRVIIPTFLPNTLLLHAATSMFCILLPILLFCQLKREVIKTVLAGTLSHKHAIIVGGIVGIICTAIILSSHVLSNSSLVQSGLPAFQGKGTIELLKTSYYVILKQAGYSCDFPGLLYYTLFVCILVPFGEEIIFQGWLQTKLSKTIGSIMAALIVSIVFVLCHRSINLFMFIGFLLFALIRMRTGSLLCCSIAHAVTNLGFIVICVMLGIHN